MCARMGVVTGKGLSDLIREEFGFRPTFFVMITGFFVDLANVVAEFAGVAAAMQIFGINRYVAVPIAAILVWVLVIRGTHRQVETIFLFACVLYLSYVFSAFFAKPDWLTAAKETVLPSLSLNSGYLLMLTGLVGTTIAPWQFFYLQAGFVEKKVGPRQYRQARADVLVGSISCMVIVVWAGVVLLPHAPLWKILIFSQVGNGIWLPVVVIFILLLVNRRDLMGEYVNTMAFNIVAWATAIGMIALTLILTYTALFQQSVPPPP